MTAMPLSPNRLPSQNSETRTSIWHTDITELFSNAPHRRLPLRDIAVFCRKTAFLLDAGLPLKSAMPILAEQVSGRGMRQVISDLHKRVMQGESFTSAVNSAKVFPAFLCGYAAVGERTAQLPEVCARLADYYEEQAKAEEELMASFMYPIAVMLMMFAVIVLAVTLVLPGYASIFSNSGMSLPFLTSALLGVSYFISANIFILLFSFLAVFIAAVAYSRSSRGQVFFSRLKLRVPLFRQFVNYRLSQVMSVLLNSGLSVQEALPLCAKVVENSQVKNDLITVLSNVASGMAFWESLERVKYIDPLMIGLARIGERSGKLPQTMEKNRKYSESQYKHTMRRMNKLLEPVITLVLGIILAAVMLAVILPTFEMAVGF